MVEHLFEVLDRGALAALSDEELDAAVAAATRTEARASAQRLALVGEVTARWCDDEDTESASQVIDGWAHAKAQVGAACNIGPWAASKQMSIATSLRNRLPRTEALFATGAVSARVIDAVTWRTKLITDPDAMALVDAAIAGVAADYGTRSDDGLIAAVDLWVEKFDPAAVIRSRSAAKDRYVEFDDRDDPNGVCSFWGRLRVTDRKVLEQRLNDLADTVCADDPRSTRERRADALGALGVVGPALQRLTCLCGNPACDGSGKDVRSAAVSIYVLTDRVPDAATGTPAPPEPTPLVPGPRPIGPDTTQPEPSDPEPRESAEKTTPAPPEPTEPAATAGGSADPAPPAVGVLLGGGVIPAAMLADLIGTGATVRSLPATADLGTERRYRPSAKLSAFVRLHAMTCMFPGCNRAAHTCDLDHLIPWPAGATHPGNMFPLCREHHLVKTFCGWVPTARPDGSVEWTAPAGHSYVKRPGAAILFPDNRFDIPIPRRRAIRLLDDSAGRSAKMPKRQRTRTRDREQRVNAERARNILERALEDVRNGSDPPPF